MQVPPSRVSLPRKGHRVGLRIVLFEACSAFTHVTACTLALSPIRDTLSEGFSYFVTSIAAPAGAFAGWDLHPLESAALSRRTPISDIVPLGNPQRSGTPTILSVISKEILTAPNEGVIIVYNFTVLVRGKRNLLRMYACNMNPSCL